MRANGWKAVRTAAIPLERHQHRGWPAYPEAERDRLSKRNFYRFLKHWGDRRDLLLQPAPRNERACHADVVSQVKHRVHVVPWLRRPGRLLLKEWLAITIGRDIFCWRELNPAELNHELAHVRQWRSHGAAFALVYLGASSAQPPRATAGTAATDSSKPGALPGRNESV